GRRPARRDGRRRDREGGPDPRLQRHAGRSQGRQADPDRIRDRGWEALPDRQAQRNEGRLMPAARLKQRYLEEIRPQLIERFGYSTPMQAPRIEKITVNMGVGDAKQDSNVLEAATDQLGTITGQK